MREFIIRITVPGSTVDMYQIRTAICDLEGMDEATVELQEPLFSESGYVFMGFTDIKTRHYPEQMTLFPKRC